jgi:hypothetical protein
MKTINRRFFVAEASRAGLAIGTLGLWEGCVTSKKSLPVASPESQGVDSQSILNFLDAANACDYEWHSFMMLRHGKVIARGWWDPFKPEYVHTLYSLSKSFTSTAVGFAVDEGRINLDDRNIKMVEGIHGDQITFRFDGQDLGISMINSVALHDPNERNRESRSLLKGRVEL